MTMDKSLKRKGRLSRSRNVLKRGERINQLKFEDRWNDSMGAYALPKVRVVKVVIGKKKKKKAAADDDNGKKK